MAVSFIGGGDGFQLAKTFIHIRIALKSVGGVIMVDKLLAFKLENLFHSEVWLKILSKSEFL